MPSCNRCAKKGATCEYDVEPNVHRSISLRRRHDALQSEVQQLRELFEFIRACSDAEASEIFRRLRIATDPLEVIRFPFAVGSHTATVGENQPISSTSVRGASSTSSPESTFKDGKNRLEPDLPPDSKRPYCSLTVPHKVLTWPYVYSYLIDFGIVPASVLDSVLQKGTAWFIEGELLKHPNPLPWGRYTCSLDSAAPGKHTLLLYGALSREDAGILAQARTGHTHLRDYLARTRQIASPICECKGGAESVKHVILHCPMWASPRRQLREVAGDRWGWVSFLLGGKSRRKDLNTGKLVDGDGWRPDLAVVKATIAFLKSTGRFAAHAQVEQQL